jgi:uncharacterized membrane protein YsdA (DUF1294 family)
LTWPLGPSGLCLAYVVASTVSYVQYALDKRAARLDRRRTPERHLHLVDLMCGWPGGWIAQRQYRHKLAKAAFRRMYWMTVLANLAVVVSWIAWWR